MKVLNVGMVSVGGGGRAQIDYFNSIPGGDVSALYDARREMLESGVKDKRLEDPYLTTDLSEVLSQENIVCIAADPWFSLPRRRHKVMSEFAKANRVLYVEPPFSVLTPFADPSRWRSLTRWTRRAQRVDQNLFVYRPINVLPLARFGALRTVDERFISALLKREALRLHFENPILWIYAGGSRDPFIGLLNEKLVCYDCFDKMTAFAGMSDQAKLRIQEWERNVVQRADLVFVASDRLHRDLVAFNPRTHVIPNGVDFEHFNKAMRQDTTIPADIDSIRRPIVGYVGAIQHKVDLGLLSQVADVRPEWSIVMVGPDQLRLDGDRRDFARFGRKKNVHLLGTKDYALLPNYLKAMDACVMPFRRHEQVQYASHPNKLSEYLAAGKPVVAMDAGGEYACPEAMRVASSYEEFVALVSDALTGDNTPYVDRGLEFARANTWRRNVATMASLIRQRLTEAPHGRDGSHGSEHSLRNTRALP